MPASESKRYALREKLTRRSKEFGSLRKEFGSLAGPLC